jgi:tRNA U34 2-thiouridine synthase MnmA/TrmU
VTPSAIKVRGLGLCSGGLDSTLAGLVLRKQNIEVEWISFETPFFSAIKARRSAEQTGIPLTVENISDEYITMLRNPNCGYGQHMNPCLDCHALMFRVATRFMVQGQFDFLFSGEVVGQRPMSQTKPSLRYVEKNSDSDGYILRPLSAKLLPETIPEKEGLVDREQLLDISGRGRKRQIQLAKSFGITDYPAPAGGCLLTDKGFSERLRDLFDHQETTNENELSLLRYGRHFRLNDQSKLIVGRTQIDNEKLLDYHNPQTDTVIKVKRYPGPIGILPHGRRKDVITLAASICAGYSKASALTAVEVGVMSPEGRSTIKVLGLLPSDVSKFLV